jgi:restriction system protein
MSDYVLHAEPGRFVLSGGDAQLVLGNELPTLLTQTLIIPESKTAEGVLIASMALPWRRILKLITEDPSQIYQIDPWKWEEIIAGSYQESGLFDEVILTPRGNDGGKDVIAIKKGYGAIRFVESVKKYKPGNEVTADDVRALGFLLNDPKNSKGIVSTTWKFAPKIEEDPLIKQFMPYRLELVDGEKLIDRFKLWGNLGEGKS